MADFLRFNMGDYVCDCCMDSASSVDFKGILDGMGASLVKALDDLSSLSPVETAFMDRYCQMLHEFPIAQRQRILYFMSIM